MKPLYQTLRVDAERLRFAVTCPLCGRVEYGPGLPLVCRGVRILARCMAGRADRWRQSVFNHARADAVQQLALRLNQCHICHRWVCDGCYKNNREDGICTACSAGLPQNKEEAT